MRGLYLLGGTLVIILILGGLTRGSPFILVPVTVYLGIAVVVALRKLERGITPRIGWGWWLWGALLPVCVAAAVWAEETADEGCADTLSGTVLATLALVLIGAGASSLPAIWLRSIVTHAGVQRSADFLFSLVISAVWLAIWGYFWLVLWQLTLGCGGD